MAYRLNIKEHIKYQHEGWREKVNRSGGNKIKEIKLGRNIHP